LKYLEDKDKLIKNRAKMLKTYFPSAREKDIERLLRNSNRWNWMKYKKNIYTKVGSGAGKIGSNIILGEIVKGQLEARTDYEVGTAAEYILPEGFSRTGELLETVGLGYASKKVIDKTWIPKLFKTLTSDKGRKFLKDKLSRKVHKRLLAASKVAKKGGKLGTFAAAVYGGYTIGSDIVDAVNNFTEEDPVISRGPEMERRGEDLRDLPEAFNANTLIGKYKEEYSTPYKTEETGLGKLFEGTTLSIAEPVTTVDENTKFKLLKEFKNKYKLNDRIITLLSKFNSPSATKKQKEDYKTQINKELRKLGVHK
jgi:hypothetical protein